MKTTKLIAMSMALCLGATSAFGQVKKIGVLYGGDECSNAKVIPTDSIGVDSIGKVTCFIASNEKAKFSVYAGANDCWLSDADNDVWFEFTTPGTTSDTSYYTISSDNGVGIFDVDMQLALYDDCSGTRLACSEDDGDCNTLAAGFTVKLAGATRYYLQADIFGADNFGKFALTIFENAPPINDCFLSPVSIQDGYDNLGAKNFNGTGWFVYNNYAYLDAAFDSANAPTWQSVTGHDGLGVGCNSAFSENTLGGLRHDVWFKFTYDPDEPALLNLYSKHDCNAYVMEAFTSSGTNDCNSASLNLDFLGCSVQDGLASNGDLAVDWAIGDFLNHPRLNLDGFKDDLTGSTDIYIRVFQYTRVLVGDPNGETEAPPSEGLIKFAFERYTNDDLAADSCGVNTACIATTELNAGCDSAGFNFSKTFTNLSNANSRGGLSAIEGTTDASSADGRANEATEFVVANGTTRAEFNCDSTLLITGGKVLYNNNSSYYRFSVGDTIDTVVLSDYEEILRVDVPLPDNPVAQSVQVILDLCDGLSVGTNNDPPIVTLPPGGLGVCDQGLTTVCGADVSFRFSNLNYCGPNGAVAVFYVVPANDTCTDQSRSTVAAAFGELPDNSCDTCLFMGPSSFYLPSGDYYLVVDGDDGSLVNFDLEFNIEYFIPGTVIPCGFTCGSTGTKRTLSEDLATKKLADIGFVPTTISPQPAENFINIAYNAGKEGMVQYTVVNMTGQTIDQGSFAVNEGEGVKQFDTSDFAPGMYAYTMILDGVRTQFKLMKQ
ncbi:MAG: hypothetical protein ACJAUV_000270 [Flavobacteriales bacterium]|jgi:hypothetical protein